MSQTQYIQLLKSQLRMLNRIIDEKIMQGKSYSTEARRHKMILSPSPAAIHESVNL
jgi:hypothetical protein